MIIPPETLKQKRILRNAALVSAYLIIFIVLLNLGAWHSHNSWIVARAQWVFEMRYNTGVLLLTSAVGLLAALYERQRLVIATGMITMLIGGLTVLEYIMPLDSGIDQLFFKDYVHGFVLGRMAPNTAVALFLMGLALLILTLGHKERALRTIIKELLGCLVFGLAATALAGHLESVEHAFTWGSPTHMSVQTSIAIMLWSCGFMALIWQRQSAPIARIPLWFPALLCFMVLLFDLATPLGLTAGVAYIPLIFCSLWFNRPHTSFVFAFIATILTILGYYASPAGPFEDWIVITNRVLSIGAVWFVATLVYMLRQRELKLKGSDNKLRAVVDNVVDGLITINERGAIESFNPACENIFGYRAEEVLGQNIKILMPEPYHSEHDGYLSHYAATGNPHIIGTSGREVRGRRKDGSIFPMDLSVSAFQLKDGQHFSGVVRDITERKEAEKAQEQLRQIQKIEALGQLTGGVAHDFNNILAVILGNLDFLQERTRDNKALQEFIRPSVEAALHGSELTQRLLAFGRKQALQPKTISLNELIAQFSVLVRRTLGERIKIITTLAEDLQPANVDPSQLEAAILNLSVNARDAMPEGGILTYETSNVTVTPADHSDVPPGNYVMLAVCDTGTGMSPEIIKKAFEPFFTTKQIGKGSGLGLSMVYGFVKQSAGHIFITSEPGKGSSIRIYFPIAEGEAVSLNKKITEKPIEAKGKTRVILVVEDNKHVLKLTSAMVESLGYAVIQAETGEAAIAILKARNDIDLLLSDVMLPGELNGPALAKQAVKLLPNIKVLFNSGYAADYIFQSGLLEEGAQLLSKPFRKRQLAEKISALLK